MLETEDLLDVIDLGVVLDLIVRRVSNVQEFTAKREDTVLVARRRTFIRISPCNESEVLKEEIQR